ncbi:PAAR domain-containing protein [uncultured Desulfovibrio sp.]|uniref:PAAR domain-containing protein n=1 Tax=uncultured Desulfovibrio sp. TaxID=167968 RepID=UPI003209B45B
MSEKPVARVGDTGSHGGSITTGSNSIFVNSKPIARVGDIYNCPEHGPNPIVTGAPYIFGNDVLVAHVGSKTACGAEITSGSPDVFINIPLSGKLVEAFAGVGKYSEQFCVISDMTGEPLVGVEYRIITQKGNIYEGKTDHDGKTVRVYTDEPENIECFID